MKPWLIQRGKFKETAKENIEGIDSLIRLDYMGSSEFEWGALPQSLKRMVAASKDYSMNKVSEVKAKSGEVMFLYCDKTKFEEIKKCAIHLSRNKYGYKEYCDMVDYVERNNEKSHSHNNFWWDIEYDYIVVFGDEQAEKIQIAMEKLKEKWTPEPPAKKTIVSKILGKNK